MNTLIVYYTWSGNTRRIAGIIKAMTGGTVFEIRPGNAYPESYDATVEQAKKEIQSGFRPALIPGPESIVEYDAVFVGSPNWWSTIAPPAAAFLAEHDLSGKTVVPFCTHGGGGEARVLKGIGEMCPGSKVLEGLCVYGNGGQDAEGSVSKWLMKTGIIKAAGAGSVARSI